MEFRNIDLNNSKDMVKLWNNNIRSVFPMDEKLFVQNYSSDRQNKKILGAFKEETLAGFIIYKQWSYKSGMLKPNSDIGYINSIVVDMTYRKSGVGSALLNLAEKDLKVSGVKLIRAGSDTYHFFPGIPSQCLEAVNFFTNRGYMRSESYYDLICDISKVELEKLPGVKLNTDRRYTTELLEESEKESLFEFFKKNFSGRWYEEFLEFFEIGMEPRDIVVLKKESKIIGFAHIYDDKSRFIGPPIYWRELLGENYGGLGPIGLDEDYRKCGLGVTILHSALEVLKCRGVKKMVIDWTDREIIDFYGKFNFMVWKEYVKAVKSEI